jgi:Protein of unknown function (DUF3150)
MSNALQERAMLVNLSVSSWTASKKDNKAGDSVKAQAAAAAKAGWFNKRLVDPTALAPISKLEGRLRDFHYKFTLPWGDNGDRVLPGAAFMDYTAGLRTLKDEFDAAVAKFVADYPQLVQNARLMLGKMYEPGDYPTPSSIAQRFAVRTAFSPVPDAADFRVDVGAEAIEEIKKNITANVENRLKGATRECWDRLAEVVGTMYERLNDPEAVFRDSLVENLRTLVGILPKLNITNDANLNNALVKIRDWLLVSPDDLRRSKKLRALTAEKAYLVLMEIKPWTTPTTTP